MNHIPSYFKQEVENLTCQQKQTLEESGIGSQVFTDLVTQTLPKLMKLPNYQSINV